MFNPQRILIAMAWALGIFWGQTASADEKSAPASEGGAAACLPDNALALVVLREGDKQIEELRQWLESPAVTDLPIYQRLTTSPQFAQAKFAWFGLAGAAGSDPWSATGAVVGREAALAAYPGVAGDPGFVLVIQTRSPELLAKLVDSAHALAGLMKDGKPDEAKSFMVGDVRVFSGGTREFHCLAGDLLLLSNQRPLLERALKLRGQKDGRLIDSREFKSARESVPATARAWGYFDLAALRKTVLIVERVDEPMVAYLFGGWRQIGRSADRAVAWVDWKDQTLTVNARAEATGSVPATHKAFTWRPERAPAWQASSLPGYMGEMQLTRDWAELISQREALLSPNAASQVVNFVNTASTLMGGMNFTEDLLANLAGPLRLVVARQDFSKLPVIPTPKLPAFALVAPLKKADTEFVSRLYSGAMSSISIISADATQKGNPALLVDALTYKDIRIVTGAYAKSGAGMGADTKPQDGSGEGAMSGAAKPIGDIRQNFAPAIAVVQQELVIATSPQMVRDIIDLRTANPAAAGSAEAAAGADRVVVELDPAVGLLRENQQELVTNRMLEEDLPRERAAEDIQTFLALVDLFKSVELRTQPILKDSGWGYDGVLEIRFAKQKPGK